MVLELELDVGRGGLFACHDGIDELIERDVLFALIVTELSLLLFRGRLLVLRVGRDRNGGGEGQCAGGGKNATESHLENSC